MDVPAMTMVNMGLLATFAGAGCLLLTALWWARVGDGVSVATERWGAMRLVGMAGWLLWVGGLALQVLGHFGMVGVATW